MRSRLRHAVGVAALALLTPLLWAAPAAAANTPYNVRVGYGCASYPNTGWSVNDGWGTWTGTDSICGGSLWTYPNGSTAHSYIKWWAKAPCDARAIAVAVDIPSWDANFTNAHYTVSDPSGRVIATFYMDQSSTSGEAFWSSAEVTGCQAYTVTLDDLGTYAGPHVVIGGADVRIQYFTVDSG
jgi:hypothetical protein